MLKYRVKGQWKDKPIPTLICATPYKDIAEYLADHAAEAFAENGNDLITIVEIAEGADMFSRKRGSRED